MRIHEIFLSIQGESASIGLPTVFVRTTGCHLRCRWCDTEYAFYEGSDLTVEQIASRVDELGRSFRRVCLTGGEPLLQPREEIQALLDRWQRHEVSIETSGAVPLGDWRLHDGQRWVMDVKCPGSRMAHRMCWENVDLLRPQDEAKFVVADRADFDWALRKVAEHRLDRRCRLLFSPVHGELKAADLACWVLDARLDARVQLQLHKLIWGAEARGV